MPRKRLTAIVSDVSVLRLDEMETRRIIGDHQLWLPEGSDVRFLTCLTPDWRAAQKFLVSMGATVLPWHRDPSTQVANLLPANAPNPLPANIAGTDTGWQAHQKLFDRYGWPPFDPMQD